MDYSWEELVTELKNDSEKELILNLAHQVTKVNKEENKAYQKLINLLNLPIETVKNIEESNLI